MQSNKLTKIYRQDQIRINACYDGQVEIYNKMSQEEMQDMVNKTDNKVYSKEGKCLTGTYLKAWQDSVTFKSYEKIYKAQEEAKLKEEILQKELETLDNALNAASELI